MIFQKELLKIISFVAFFLLSVSNLTAVDLSFLSPGEPAFPYGIDWMVSTNQFFNIYYDRHAVTNAARISAYLKKAEPYLRSNLCSAKEETWDLILNHTSMTANGYVNSLLNKSEWYSRPIPSFQTEWFLSLAVHEGRHMTQYDSFKTGSVKYLRFLYGRYGAAVWAGANIPSWFLEGDAVLQETLMTKGGRGRDPSFLKMFLSMHDQKRPLSYIDLVMGSEKEYLPNIYQTGYLMVNRINAVKGADVWEKIISETFESGVPQVSFALAVKDIVGKRLKTIYKEAFDHYVMVADRQRKFFLTNYPSSIRDKTFVNDHREYVRFYSHPVFGIFGNDETVYVFYGSEYQRKHLVRFTIDEAGRRNGRVRNVSGVSGGATSLSAGGHWLAWEETRPDPLFGRKSGSVIVLYDTSDKRRVDFLKGHRAVMPALSPEGHFLAYVEILDDTSRRISVTTVNSKDPFVLSRGYDRGYSSLFWISENKLAAVETSPAGNEITLYTFYSNHSVFAKETLYGPAHEKVRSLSFSQGYLFFHSAISGDDMIWALNMSNRGLFLVKQGTYGASMPFAGKNGKLIFCDGNGVYGNRLAVSDLNTNEFLKQEDVRVKKAEIFDQVQGRSYTGAFYKAVSNSEVYDNQVLKNRKEASPFQFDVHTRGIFADTQSIYAAFLLSDLFSRLTVSAGAGYNYIYKSPDYSFGIEFNGVPSVKLQLRRLNPGLSSLVTKTGTVIDELKWREDRIDLGTRLRVIKSRYGHALTFNLGVTGGARYLKGTPFSDNVHREVWELPAEIRLSGSFALSRSLRDPFAPFGLTISGGYKKAFISGSDFFDLNMTVSFRPFIPMTGIKLKGYYGQTSYDDGYIFFHRVSLPRGIPSFYTLPVTYGSSAEFHFPVAFPDFNIFYLLYLKKIRGNLFYDIQGYGLEPVYKNWPGRHLYDHSTAGIELNFDFTPLSQSYLSLTAGLGAAYSFKSQEYKIYLTVFETPVYF